MRPTRRNNRTSVSTRIIAFMMCVFMLLSSNGMAALAVTAQDPAQTAAQEMADPADPTPAPETPEAADPTPAPDDATDTAVTYPMLDFGYTEPAPEDETREQWIERQLRILEELANSGIMPLAFVVGHIPWKTPDRTYFTATGLPSHTTVDSWLEWCERISPEGYLVDNTGVKYTKFPQFVADDGIHYVNVTVNGVEVVRAGILVPDNDPDGEPVYYYMTQQHVDSDSTNDGSGSHTGAVSALLLPEDAKFSVNYAVNDYKYSYQVLVDGKDVTGEIVDPTAETPVTWEQAIFLGQNPVGSTGGVVSFNVTVPYGYTARVWQYTEDGTGVELTGDRADITDETERAAKVVNEGYPLGTEPTYRVDGAVYLNENSPSAKRMSAVFFDDHVTENRKIVVELTPDTQPPVFDAHFWLRTNNASGRGTTAANIVQDGKYVPNLERAEKDGNVTTEDAWNWNNGVLYNDPRGLNENDLKTYNTHWYQEEDGTWSLLWALQTNSGDVYIMNSLELNGVYIDIPFKPIYSRGGRGSEDVLNNDGEGESTTTATLPDGAQVTLTYYRQFNNNDQRVYILEIKGARSNVTVTGGNFMQYRSGAEEYVATVLTGVTGDGDGANTDSFGFYSNAGDWKTQPKVLIQVQRGQDPYTNFNGDPTKKYANLRFKLQPGYENPVYLWEDRVTGAMLEKSDDGTVTAWDSAPDTLESNTIYGPDADGWYYIRISDANKPGGSAGHKMCVFTLTATSMRYMVRYMVGKEAGENETNPDLLFTNAPKDDNVDNMPSYSKEGSEWDDGLEGGIAGEHIDRYDDNNGLFYTLDSTGENLISISDAVPITKNREKTFLYWVLVDEAENLVRDQNGRPIIIQPNGTMNLSQVLDSAVSLNSKIGGSDYNYYVVRLKGVWSDTPTEFRFYIRMVWTDETTNETHVMDLVQNVITSSTDPNLTDGCLSVTINTVTETFKNWFRQHPFYAYAVRNFIPTAARPDDVYNDDFNNTWEQYPTDFTAGSANGIPDPNAYYRVEWDEAENVRYVVQPDSTIILYLDKTNGLLPVTKTIHGSDRGADTFNYTITAKLGDVDLDRIKGEGGGGFLTPESLLYLLPNGTYFGFAPEADNMDYKDFDGAEVELHFKRPTREEARLDDIDELIRLERYEDAIAIMKNWESKATFTLKGGEATFLSLPQAHYTVVENRDNDKDGHSFEYDVKVNNVEVGDGGDISAERDVEVAETADRVSFENTVKEAKYALRISKEVVDEDGNPKAVSGESSFTFTLEPLGNYGDKVTMPTNTTITLTLNDGTSEGSDGFDDITFNHAGVYSFRVVETEYDDKNFIPAPDSHSVRVTVENWNGQLTVTKVEVDGTTYTVNSIRDAKVPFVNVYIDVNEARAILKVKKDLQGRSTLPAGMFTFKLEEVKSDPAGGMKLPNENTAIATNVNGASGTVNFMPITFTEEGTYTVRVKEVVPDPKKPGIIYDESEYLVTYTVVPDEANDGIKVDSTTYVRLDSDGSQTTLGQDEIPVFTNQAYADAEFLVEKLYDVGLRLGVAWDGDTFTINAQLIEKAGKVEYGDEELSQYQFARVTITENSVNHTERFKFRFYNEGRYVFEVTEVNEGLPGVSYDSSAYRVTVTVTADGEAMVTNVTMTKNGSPYSGRQATFENKYSQTLDVPVQAKKVLHGATLQANWFQFELMANAPNAVSNTTNNTANGDITFTLRGLSAGTYTYTLREVTTRDPRRTFTYDETEYKVVVNVSDTQNGPVATVTYYKVEPDGTEQLLPGLPTFVNEVRVTPYLEITNTVAGNLGNRGQRFTYTIELTDESGEPIDGTYGGVTFVEGKAEITLRHGESVILTALPENTQYTVIQTSAEGYETTLVGTAKIIKSDGSQPPEELDQPENMVINGPYEASGKLISGAAHTVDYTNTRTGSVPTDATTEYRWLVTVFLLSGCGLLWLIGKRRRRV